jgi:hypothetical protein
MPEAPAERIAIVGGGIAGLFCALVLARMGRAFSLFEATERLGGRIRTIRLNKDNEARNKDNWRGNLEFYAEFGPMRIELDKQLLLKSLLMHLEIEPKPAPDSDKPYLNEFPAYASPTSVGEPQYELRPEEAGKNPLQLLQMAMLRIVVHLEMDGACAFAEEQKRLIRDITLAAATQEPVEPIFGEWMKRLTPEHYWDIQTKGLVSGVPLYAIGFWNLLSDHLSHNAISKLRDLGTFYHLLPENPNAAEWLVWWLLGFAISEKLQGVFGGMECIVDELVGKLPHGNLHPDCRVVAVKKTDSNRLKLDFGPGAPAAVVDEEYDRVILALSKSPLQSLVRESGAVFAAEQEISQLMDSAFGFPMVKTFYVVKNRWWEEENRANRYATRVPTRELHYWKALTKDSRQGMIMAYTDRPASAFWANYVPPGEQTDVHRSREKELPEPTRKRLVKKAVQYIKENDVPEITPEDIVWYGIRDWGREPFGGANHAWRPERQYWVVMRRLADIPVRGPTETPTVHVCGEAYSDYHGFMEGSLRSAAYVLHRILDKKEDGSFDFMPWLLAEDDPGADRAALRVEKNYLQSLQKWAERLDGYSVTTSYLYDPDAAPRR